MFRRSLSIGVAIAQSVLVGWLVIPGLAAADDAPAGGAAGAVKPLGVEDYETGNIEVALLEVKRTSGDTVTVKWSFRNKGDAAQEIEKLVSDEHYLVDAAAKKKYFVVKDSQGKWVALNRDFNNINLKEGQTFKMWAKFPAPPAATEKITVYIRGTPPFEDVPIAK